MEVCMDPIEITEYPGFYKIPGYSKYALSKTGELKRLDDPEKKLKGSTNPDGYHNFRIVSDNGITLTWGRHRLLGFVFKHPGCDITNLVVNHLNGKKGDDFLENLEWTTYVGNLHHASKMCLSNVCIPVQSRDVLTGEITNFPTVAACAAFVGITKDACVHRLKFPEDRVFPERRQYRKSNFSEPWKTTDVDLSNIRFGVQRRVLVKDVLTGDVVTFNSASEAAVSLGIGLSALSVRLNSTKQLLVSNYKQAKWQDDPNDWRFVQNPHLEMMRSCGKRPLKLTDNETGEDVIFTSIKSCADFLGLKVTTLHERIKHPVIKQWGKYSYRYLC